MELSNYTRNQLYAVAAAIECTLIDIAGKEMHTELATDLTYMKGEVRMALSDKESDERELPFPVSSNHTLCK